MSRKRWKGKKYEEYVDEDGDVRRKPRRGKVTELIDDFMGSD